MSDELAAGLWGAVLGAIAGGLVSFMSERHHDSRRRKQALLDQFSDICFDFVANVQTYWSTSGQDNVMQASILAGINKIKAKITQLGFDLVEDKGVRLLVKEVYQFSTGGMFATVGRQPDPSRARNVESRIEKLSSAMAKTKNRVRGNF